VGRRTIAPRAAAREEGDQRRRHVAASRAVDTAAKMASVQIIGEFHALMCKRDRAVDFGGRLRALSLVSTARAMLSAIEPMRSDWVALAPVTASPYGSQKPPNQQAHD